MSDITAIPVQQCKDEVAISVYQQGHVGRRYLHNEKIIKNKNKHFNVFFDKELKYLKKKTNYIK